MTEPIINIHIVREPALPQTWPRLNSGSEDRIEVLDLVHSKIENVIPLVEAYKQQPESRAEYLDEILTETYKRYPINSDHPEWGTLDVIIYQASEHNVDAIEAGGVGGKYGNGDDIGGKPVFAPHILLYMLPGFEEEMEATAVHEFGHFLRHRATSEVFPRYFNQSVFEEGLSESLVKATLSEERVYHKGQVTHAELLNLKKFIDESLSDEVSGEKERTITKSGYRLGYKLV